MTDDWKPPAASALDDAPFPDQLSARAIDSGGDDDRVHGYAVLGDLAVHYRYSDLVFLSLTGELPDEQPSALFELALFSVATPSVGVAGSHLAVLSRLTEAPLSSALAAGMVAAADRARLLVDRHAALLAWLAAPSGAPPAASCGTPDPWVATLAAAARRIAPDVALPLELAREAASLAVFHAAGVRTPDQLVGAIVTASLCGMTAEAIATGPAHLSSYPVRVPPFRYEE
ncbi:MAG: hypothetical protein KIT31_05065 [Deltaproteobacteria bacterium]|nr:hypothetical protein [Deltaproteobacteria bacterium]